MVVDVVPQGGQADRAVVEEVAQREAQIFQVADELVRVSGGVEVGGEERAGLGRVGAHQGQAARPAVAVLRSPPGCRAKPGP